jgi:hypothetical protein
MKIGGHPIDLTVDMGTKHSVVTQLVGPHSNKHTTIIGATGDRVFHPFVVSRQCNLRSHEVRHEFLYLPDCPVCLMGRDLLCKLETQITFDSDGTTTLNLRGPEAKTLILTVKQEEEWQLYVPEGRLLEIPKLPFKIPGVWAEDNSPSLAQNVLPVVVELKPGATCEPETVLHSLQGPGKN